MNFCIVFTATSMFFSIALNEGVLSFDGLPKEKEMILWEKFVKGSTRKTFGAMGIFLGLILRVPGCLGMSIVP